MSSEYIGKGEESAGKILSKLFDCNVSIQVPLTTIADVDLGPDHNKHKFDLIVNTEPPIVVEVNLGHGPIAEKKWEVYKEYVEQAGWRACTIEANECEHLFESDPNDLVWQDYIDVINALNKAEIDPQ